jgi:hypothetical protein
MLNNYPLGKELMLPLLMCLVREDDSQRNSSLQVKFR